METSAAFPTLCAPHCLHKQSNILHLLPARLTQKKRRARFLLFGKSPRRASPTSRRFLPLSVFLQVRDVTITIFVSDLYLPIEPLLPHLSAYTLGSRKSISFGSSRFQTRAHIPFLTGWSALKRYHHFAKVCSVRRLRAQESEDGSLSL